MQRNWLHFYQSLNHGKDIYSSDWNVQTCFFLLVFVFFPWEWDRRGIVLRKVGLFLAFPFSLMHVCLSLVGNCFEKAWNFVGGIVHTSNPSWTHQTSFIYSQHLPFIHMFSETLMWGSHSLCFPNYISSMHLLFPSLNSSIL